MAEREEELLSGALAIVAGLCWFAWAVVNVATSHRLEQSAGGTPLALANAGLTVGWNLLLAPAALCLHRRYRDGRSTLLLAATSAGLLSMALWSFGGLTSNSRNLETAYLALAAVWLLGLGFAARRSSKWFGVFTLVVGGFTALDAIFDLFEPVPFALYLLAAPKLPLAAIWSLVAGGLLLRAARVVTPEPPLRAAVGRVE